METWQSRSNADSFPTDVIFDILTRLPTKSLSRFRCVSTLWSSMISTKSFINSFMTHSLTHPPTLLISFPTKYHSERHFFTSHHHQHNPQTPTPIATHHLSIPGFVDPWISKSLSGLICVKVRGFIICNPSTREFISLPEKEQETPYAPNCVIYSNLYFAFDPVNNEHKVLKTFLIYTTDADNEKIIENWVFTLGAQSWRRIEDGVPHFAVMNGVCINGILYYRAWTTMENPDNGTIVAFDVHCESFRLITVPVGTLFYKEDVVLIERERHLCVVDYEQLRGHGRIVLWVLEDSWNGVWSSKTFDLPSNWRDVVGETEIYVGGTIHTGEIIFAPRKLSKPFYVFYYDMKSNRVRKVEIQGLPEYEFQFPNVCINITFTDHVESILPLPDLNH